MRYASSVYPVFISLRLFKAFVAQPRLALVTQTLSNAAVHVSHFLIVYCTVFFTYATSAMCLFGWEDEEYSSIGRSVNMCIRALSGDFDWDEMRQVGREEAGIWFWSFNFIVLHVMLNMLLSIILDIYMEVKGGV